MTGIPDWSASCVTTEEFKEQVERDLETIIKKMHPAESPEPAGPSEPPRRSWPPVTSCRRRPLPSFGREEELRALLLQLGGAQGGGVTISARPVQGLRGMGGVGKTALAVMLAHALAERYPGAQLFCDLRGADAGQRAPLAPAEVMSDFIRALRPDSGQLPEENGKTRPHLPLCPDGSGTRPRAAG